MQHLHIFLHEVKPACIIVKPNENAALAFIRMQNETKY
jgi:hypothetical protein